ncbi:MAG: hypothetical protein IIZ39_00785 [Blautia sp.]|nr:hypothetical protein [Blautia sp.]
MWLTIAMMFFLSITFAGRVHAEEVTYSGPIQVRREEESLKIQRAPAYDKEKAREFIPLMPDLREGIRTIEAEDLLFFGDRSPSEDARKELREALEELCQGDHFVSFLMVDARSLSGAAYRCDVPFCTQSTIKAIYVGTLLENNPLALQENGQYMRDAIVYSDNEAYERLRSIYGNDDLRRWFREVGIEEEKALPLYPRDMTVKEMVLLWTRLYAVLNGEDPENFAAYYADSFASAASSILGEAYPLQTKAGWEIGLDEALP